MRLFFSETNEEVTLPQELVTFRGDSHVVECVAFPAGGGSSGKVQTAEGRTFFPGVFGCYIADESRAVAS